MTDLVTALRCPHCGEDRLAEHDPVTGRGVCLVCARTWPHVPDVDSRNPLSTRRIANTIGGAPDVLKHAPAPLSTSLD